MNSESNSQTLLPTFADLTASRPEPEEELILRVDVPGRVPSWNRILAMEEWERYKYKQQLQGDFLSALRASAADCSTKITCAKNSTAIFADTLARYLQMRREQRKLKSDRKKLEARTKSSSELKFSESVKVPF